MDLDEYSEPMRDITRAITRGARTSKLRQLCDMARSAIGSSDAQHATIQTFVDDCNDELKRRKTGRFLRWRAELGACGETPR